MIVEGIIAVVSSVLVWVAGLFPETTVPGWFGDVADGLSTWIGYAAGLGAWVPVGLCLSVLGAILTSMVVGFAIKVVRIVASFLTAGGGSAG